MRYLDERVWVIIRELRPLIERSHTDIVKWQTKKKLFMRPEEADLDPMPWESFDSSTDRWYGKDTYYWFRAQFTVPQSMDQKCGVVVLIGWAQELIALLYGAIIAEL